MLHVTQLRPENSRRATQALHSLKWVRRADSEKGGFGDILPMIKKSRTSIVNPPFKMAGFKFIKIILLIDRGVGKRVWIKPTLHASGFVI